ncbi:hypothetical protein DRQ53_08240, partial [bacterium]
MNRKSVYQALLPAILLSLCVLFATEVAAQCADYSGAGGDDVTPVELSLSVGAANGITLVGSEAWIATTDYGGLVCVDVSDPLAPTEIGAVSFADEAFDLKIDGNLACVTWLNWGAGAGIQIVDITNSATPVLRGAISDRLTYAAEISNGYAYMATYTEGLGVVDLSDPDNPVLVGSTAPFGPALTVVIAGQYAYAGLSSPGGIQVVEINDPTSPDWVQHVPTGGGVHELFVSGDLLYAAASGSLEIFDISSPAAPVLIGSYPTPGMTRGVHVEGSIAYVSDNTAGIHWLNVSNPQAPTLIASYPTPGWSKHIIPMGEHILLSRDLFLALPNQCPQVTAAPLPLVKRPTILASPNPFNPTTMIFMDSPVSGVADLRIYTLDGRLVRVLATEGRQPGAWSVPWDGRDDAG